MSLNYPANPFNFIQGLGHKNVLLNILGYHLADEPGETVFCSELWAQMMIDIGGLDDSINPRTVYPVDPLIGHHLPPLWSTIRIIRKPRV